MNICVVCSYQNGKNVDFYATIASDPSMEEILALCDEHRDNPDATWEYFAEAAGDDD